MSELFLNVLNMSISASWMVLAALLLRKLLKKAPRWLTVVLWGLVAVRLVFPFSVESVLSLIPSEETVPPDIMTDREPQINSGIPIINSALNPIITDSFAPTPEASANPLQILIPILAAVWLLGMAVLAVYAVISCTRVKKRVSTAVILRDNVFQCETVGSPFVFGLIKPRIYIPFDIDEKNAPYVIAHENAHIKRRDHIWKPLGFLLLAVHWFNPLMWVGYVFLCKDIELACDERVVAELGENERADYSEALLALSVSRRMISACPLAFGEVGVKERVKGVLSYKKPAFWIIVFAAAAIVITSFCLLTDPKGKPLSSIGIDGLGGYADSTAGIMTGNGTVYYSVEDIDGAALEELFKLRISKKPSSDHPKPEMPDKTHTLILHTLSELELISSGDKKGTEIGLFICFSKDFREVFVTRGEDVAYPHKVISPKKAEKIFNKLSNITVVNNAPVIGSTSDIDKLKQKYPMYYGLPTDNGLTLYVWQMAKDSYSCGLLAGKEHDEETVWNMSQNPASMYDMRIIVTSYSPEIQRHNLNIVPINVPQSSYHYEIDDEYRESVYDLFWAVFLPIYDTILHDIDGDGKDEYCSIGFGPTSGLFSFTVRIVENGKVEYEDVFVTPWYELFFAEHNGEAVIVGVTHEDRYNPSETHVFKISFSEGRINLTRIGTDGEKLEYLYK